MKNLQELPRLGDSMTYLYIEHAIIEQSEASIVAIRKDGRIPIPIAAMTCLLLGPGTNITHAAIRAICDNGCMAIWCGEKVARFYACGIGETRSAKNLLHQAKVCMNENLHMQAVRKMYTMRFPDIDTTGYTLQQIRGMEGIRMRKAYEVAAKASGVKWKKRSYKSQDWDEADPINQALSEANAILYGLCHAGIVSLGYSAGLGFIHTGKQLSFVYDIADLYKTETTIPAAFEAVQMPGDRSRNIRMVCRKYLARTQVLARMAKDIATILDVEIATENDNAKAPGQLWDSENKASQGGKNYAQEVGDT